MVHEQILISGQPQRGDRRIRRRQDGVFVCAGQQRHQRRVALHDADQLIELSGQVARAVGRDQHFDDAANLERQHHRIHDVHQTVRSDAVNGQQIGLTSDAVGQHAVGLPDRRALDRGNLTGGQNVRRRQFAGDHVVQQDLVQDPRIQTADVARVDSHRGERVIGGREHGVVLFA